MIFSVKALIYTIIGLAIGAIFFFILKAMGMWLPGVVVLAIFGIIGFTIGSFKIPDSNAFKLTQKVGGENIDSVINRYIKFKMKNSKIYVNDREEIKDDKR